VARLREAGAREPRPPALGSLELSLTPPGYGLDRAAAEHYAALGFHRLILRPPKDLDAAGLEDFVRRAGADLIGKV
jgi:hypothetical protein